MKKHLPLYFLLITSLLNAQDFAETKVVDNNYQTIFNELSKIKLDNENYAVVDKNYANFDDKNMIQNQVNYFSEVSNLNKRIESNYNTSFDTFDLIKRLEKLNHQTPFNIVHNATLERYIRVYLRDHNEKIARIKAKTNYYFPLFEEYLTKYNLPLELKYLSIVESALDPNAISAAGAKGLWQFMYGTGKQFGLEINSMIDERSDPIKSTEAACKYLKSLHQTFNDWDLALAAYNAGPGNVTKAIRRSGGNRNYWEIRHFLPQETRGYLPAFYSMLYILEFEDFHNIESKNTELTFIETDTIHINRQLSFIDVSSQLDLDLTLIKQLNPQYKNDVIPFSNEKIYSLTLPKKYIGIFLDSEYKNSNQRIKSNHITSGTIPINKLNSYKVKEGDNLNKIAKKFGISIQQLKEWNGLQTNYLIADQHLVISNK